MKNKTAKCEVCFNKQGDDYDYPFYLYDIETNEATQDTRDKMICKNCVDWVCETKELAVEQIKQPGKNLFKDVDFWWKSIVK